jgi:hypothetical protein
MLQNLMFTFVYPAFTMLDKKRHLPDILAGLTWSYYTITIKRCSESFVDGARWGKMLAKSALHDMGTSFFKLPCQVASWEFRSSCIVTIDVVGVHQIWLCLLSFIDIHHWQRPKNEIC